MNGAGDCLALGEGIQMIHGKGRGDAPARLLDQCTGPVGNTAAIGGRGSTEMKVMEIHNRMVVYRCGPSFEIPLACGAHHAPVGWF